MTATRSPEWFALDAAMSYFIAGGMDNSHMLTYRTTKDVKCLYFDGTSASLMDDGSMDAQMLLLHNTSANLPDRPAFGPPPRRNGSYGFQPCFPGRGYQENRTRWNPLQAEYDRAAGLCDFIREKKLGGLGWGYEGIVRMNAAFELIWCNFTSPSAKLVSHINTTAPPLEGVDVPRGPWQALEAFDAEWTSESKNSGPTYPSPSSGDGGTRWPGADHPFKAFSMFEWFHVAAKRYGFVGGVPGRGEARVTVDSSGIFTFFDPGLEDEVHARVKREREVFNLTELGHWRAPEDADDRRGGLRKLGRRRREQRPRNVSVADGMYVRATVEDRLHTALSSDQSNNSGMDWVLIAQEIVADYAGDLQHLSSLVSRNVRDMNGTELQASVAELRNTAHNIWMPYYEYPRFQTDDLNDSFGLAAPESVAALKRCRFQYDLLGDVQLARGEELTFGAILEVLSAICSVTLPLFLATEEVWLTNFNNASAPSPEAASPVFNEVVTTFKRHYQSLEELMAWLGWADQYTTCTPGCGLGQVCYIPIWPTMGFGGGGGRRRPPRYKPGNETNHRYGPRPGGGWGTDAMEKYLWEPTCVDAEHYPPELRT
jgi:hypothetical protein